MGLPPSGARAPFMADLLCMRKLREPTGMLYDSLFLELVQATPSVEWYILLLAARNTMYAHWLVHPNSHTQCGSHIISLICNVLGVLDLKFLSLNCKSTHTNLTRPLSIGAAELMTRPETVLHDARLPGVITFI